MIKSNICKSEGCTGLRYRYSLYCNRCRNGIRRYRLTAPEQDQLLRDQDGKCRLCGDETSFAGKYTAVVDHNHGSKKIRGILCHWCNVALGLFEKKNLDPKRVVEYMMSA